MSNTYRFGTTLDGVFTNFHVKPQDQKTIIEFLKRENYSNLAACYVASRSEEKLSRFMGDSRFASVFINEVKKYTIKSNDPRWKEKNKK